MTPKSPDIKILEPQDRQTAQQVLQLLNTNSDDGTTRQVRETVEDVLDGTEAKITWLVAEIEGKICGCIRLERKKPRAFYLSHLKVDPQYRHNGVGRAMMDSAESRIQEIAHKSRASCMACFDVLQASKHVDWYKRRGFAIKGERNKTYLMRKRIKP